LQRLQFANSGKQLRFGAQPKCSTRSACSKAALSIAASFQRIFGATIFFGTDTQRERAIVIHQRRFNFMTEARIWYSRDVSQGTLSRGFENTIMLSDEFYREVITHPIPTDLEAVKTLSASPAAPARMI
jgi:hypothetical protein